MFNISYKNTSFAMCQFWHCQQWCMHETALPMLTAWHEMILPLPTAMCDLIMPLPTVICVCVCEYFLHHMRSWGRMRKHSYYESNRSLEWWTGYMNVCMPKNTPYFFRYVRIYIQRANTSFPNWRKSALHVMEKKEIK